MSYFRDALRYVAQEGNLGFVPDRRERKKEDTGDQIFSKLSGIEETIRKMMITATSCLDEEDAATGNKHFFQCYTGMKEGKLKVTILVGTMALQRRMVKKLCIEEDFEMYIDVSAKLLPFTSFQYLVFQRVIVSVSLALDKQKAAYNSMQGVASLWKFWPVIQDRISTYIDYNGERVLTITFKEKNLNDRLRKRLTEAKLLGALGKEDGIEVRLCRYFGETKQQKRVICTTVTKKIKTAVSRRPWSFLFVNRRYPQDDGSVSINNGASSSPRRAIGPVVYSEEEEMVNFLQDYNASKGRNKRCIGEEEDRIHFLEEYVQL